MVEVDLVQVISAKEMRMKNSKKTNKKRTPQQFKRGQQNTRLRQASAPFFSIFARVLRIECDMTWFASGVFFYHKVSIDLLEKLEHGGTLPNWCAFKSNNK